MASRLWFDKRTGNEVHWVRKTRLRPGHSMFVLGMTTSKVSGDAEGIPLVIERTGQAWAIEDCDECGGHGTWKGVPCEPCKGSGEKIGRPLWIGPVSPEGPPLRATCVAAGLCDDEGNDIDFPSWYPEAYQTGG